VKKYTGVNDYHIDIVGNKTVAEKTREILADL